MTSKLSSCYQVLVIGCGRIGGGFDVARPSGSWPVSHAGAFSRHKGFHICACVDPDRARREAFANHWGVGLHAEDVRTLGSSLRAVDVVSICSPTELHYAHVMQALEFHPKVIFCEKPLASDLSSSLSIVEACRKKGVALVVNYSRQWDPFIEEVTQQILGNQWGEIRSVVGHYNKGILNNGSHMIDLLFRIVGPLDLVTTACSSFDFLASDPTMAVLLTAKEGTLPVYLNPGHAHDYSYFELEVICEKGVVRMLSGGMGWELRGPKPSPEFIGYRTLETTESIVGRCLESMARAVSDIYKFLETGIPIRSSGENAIKVQTLCTKIQKEVLVQCPLRL